ncbi:unnamed protein product [Arctogadus glacialis]
MNNAQSLSVNDRQMVAVTALSCLGREWGTIDSLSMDSGGLIKRLTYCETAKDLMLAALEGVATDDEVKKIIWVSLGPMAAEAFLKQSIHCPIRGAETTHTGEPGNKQSLGAMDPPPPLAAQLDRTLPARHRATCVL